MTSPSNNYLRYIVFYKPSYVTQAACMIDGLLTVRTLPFQRLCPAGLMPRAPPMYVLERHRMATVHDKIYSWRTRPLAYRTGAAEALT